MNLRRFILHTGVAIVLVSLIGMPVAGKPKSGGEVSSSAEVMNEVPADVRLLSAGDNDPHTPGEQVSPVPGRKADVELRFQASDGNGWQDLREATVRIFRPDGSVHTDNIAGRAAEKGEGKRRDFTAKFTLAYDDAPGIYKVELTIIDRNGAQVVGEGAFEYQEMLAVSLDGDAITFGGGQLGPGKNTRDAPSSVGVRNAGNVPIDLHVSATALTSSKKDATIPPESIQYSGREDLSNARSLSKDGITDASFDLPPGPGSKLAWFYIQMPTGDEQYIPADTYSGRISIGAVVG